MGSKTGRKPIDTLMLICATAGILLAAVGSVLENPLFFRLAQWALAAGFVAAVFRRYPPLKPDITAGGSFSKKSLTLYSLAIVGLSFAAYFNTLTTPFFDGDEYIHLANARNLVENFSIGQWVDFFILAGHNDAEQLIRPLLNAPFIIGYLLFGTSSVGYHILNVAIFALGAVALFMMIAFLIGRTGPGLLAGAIFCAHPLISRPVAWTATLTHTAPTTLFIASLLFFVLYRKYPEKKASLIIAGVFAFADLALWELGVLLPAAFLIIDLLFFKESLQGKPWVKRWAPYIISLSIVGVYIVQLALRTWLLDIEFAKYYLKYRVGIPPIAGISGFTNAILDGIFRPFHQSVFFGLSFRLLCFLWISGHAILLLLAGLGRRFEHRLLVFGLLLCAISYAPGFNTPQVDLEYLDRARLFLMPVAGFAIVLTSFLYPQKKTGRLKHSVIIALPLMFAALTAGNNMAWNRIAHQQQSLGLQIENLLRPYNLTRPVIFLPASATPTVFDLPKNLVATQFAKRQFIKGRFAGVWRLVFNASVQVRPYDPLANQPKVIKPVVLKLDKEITTVTDFSSQFHRQAFTYARQAINTRPEELVLSIHQPTPLVLKHEQMAFNTYRGRYLVLDMDAYIITPETLKLHSPDLPATKK